MTPRRRSDAMDVHPHGQRAEDGTTPPDRSRSARDLCQRVHASDPDDAVFLACLGASYDETRLAVTAVAGAAAAMEHARCGPGAQSRAHWTLVTLAEVLCAPDLARALAATGLDPALASAMARTIAPLMHDRPFETCAPGQPVGFAEARGVPVGERDLLLRLGHLALDAAHLLRAPPRPGIIDGVALVEEPDGPGTGPWAGLLAARLDVPALTAHDVHAHLAAARARLLAHCAGARDWLDPAADITTVEVRTPAGHPGLPLAFTPVVVDDPAIHRTLSASGVPDIVLAGSGLAPPAWTH